MFRGPKTMAKMRREVMDKYVKSVDSMGCSFVEKEFQKKVLHEPKKRFKRSADTPDDLESCYLYLGDESGFIRVWDLSLLLE